jgi:glycosyltransferase involved in cell wall biosynthesis
MRGKDILYLTYNGLCQPLGQSQVIPYIIGLSKQGYKFTVLSFEHHYEKDFEKEYQKVKAQLDNAGIGWITLKYHKYPRFFSSIYDILHGIIKAISFYIKEPYYIVHARAHVTGMMALVLKRLLRTKFIFDMRGMMAEEKVDAGQWQYTSLSYKITKYTERLMLKGSDAIVVLTEKIKTYLQSFIYINTPITVIPTCVDLNRFPMRQETHILQNNTKEDGNNSPIPSLLKRGTLLLDKDHRQQMRQGLGIEDKIVIVYSGSLGTWYMFDEMVEFFKAIKSIEPKAYFLLLNKNEHDYAQRVLKEHGILPQDYMLKAVSPDEMHKYLWSSDIGLFFYKPTFSRTATYPTKLAEYLACGLPVIGNAGVGDTEEIILENNLGAIVYKFEEVEYKRAFERAMQLMNDPDFEKRAQEFVKASLSVEVGVKMYKGIYERLVFSEYIGDLI